MTKTVSFQKAYNFERWTGENRGDVGCDDYEEREDRDKKLKEV